MDTTFGLALAAIAYAHAITEMVAADAAADRFRDAGMYDAERSKRDRASYWTRQARTIRLAYFAH